MIDKNILLIKNLYNSQDELLQQARFVELDPLHLREDKI